jgi:hypothetical protein
MMDAHGASPLRQRFPGPLARLACVFALVLVAGAPGLTAQSRSGVAGTVRDAAGEPLAQVMVEAIGTRWAVRTGADGRFELALPDGSWRLSFSRIGYRTDTVTIAVSPGAGMARFDIRLVPAPITLAGLTVEATRAPAMSRTVTTETVRQVPPLAEPDIFRALVLLPGVSQPNDLKGRIHLAGGSSDETGIRLDGHPLQDPFHLLGVMGSFNVAALERADVLVHHLPPAVGGHLSGVIDMETRRPTAAGGAEVVASLLSSSATFSRRLGPGGVDVLASGRVTYLDKLVELLAPEGRIGGDEIPLVGYHDGLLRLGRSWSGGWRTELIGFTTRDVFRATLADRDLAPPPLRWGESMLGARVTRGSADRELTARAALNRSSTRMEATEFREEYVRTDREWASAAVEFVRRGGRWQAGGGAALDRRTLENAWFTSGIVHQIFSPNTPWEYTGGERQTEAAVFGELERDLGRGLQASLGARVTGVAGAWHPAPRAVVAYTPAEGLTVEAALGRRLQFDAELEEPIEGNITPPRFLLQEPRIADVAALAGTWRRGGAGPGGTGSLRAEAFWKRYTGRTLLRERDRWEELPAGFPDFTRTHGYSRGIAMSGQWSWAASRIVQGSYTFQQVREHVDGAYHPTPWDAPHDLSLFGSTPVRRGWVLNAAYAGRSGRAITPVEARVFVPGAELHSQMDARYIRGPRNSVRVAPYHRLDLGVRRSWTAGGAEWTAFGQILNVLFRENPIDYDWHQYFSELERGERPRSGRPGLPILPTVGVEVTW